MDKQTDPMDKHIDDLVERIREKRDELAALGRQIANSARQTTIVFVDLSDSTALKSEVPPEQWLGYVYEFINLVAAHAKSEGGTVIKRIGDEVMLSFDDPLASERFLLRTTGDAELVQYRFKIAIDSGEAYHFKFSDELPADPYGAVVDRCARIAGLAKAGVVLCSGAHKALIDRSENPPEYEPLGEVRLKGFTAPVKIFWRSISSEPNESFLEPLLNAVNQPSPPARGYKTMSRILSRDDLRDLPTGYQTGRPFLLRELINLPRLPMNPGEVDRYLTSSKDPDRRYTYVGYLVEWDGNFESFRRDEEGIEVNVRFENLIFGAGRLLFPLSHLEIVRSFNEGDRVFFRGVIVEASLGFTFNYVEILNVEPAS